MLITIIDKTKPVGNALYYECVYLNKEGERIIIKRTNGSHEEEVDTTNKVIFLNSIKIVG